ncbi:hypothetical protein L1887_44463 [Cichorium endivia]|nr:hypothetical protein L1887_44463 [Cichorium endivia]
MGCTGHSPFCSKNRNLGDFFIILLILSSTHARFMPQGESSSEAIANDTQVISKDEYHGKMVWRNVIVGSRPPRCEWSKYCTTTNCGKCEAIQVPIGTTPTSINTTTGDISNYKPMCWKCKCGNFTFNP